MSVDWKNVSYVLGQQIGGDFKEQSIEVDVESFCNSFKAAFAGEPSTLSNEEMQQTMQSFQMHMQAIHTEKMGKVAEQNLTEGTAFLADNAKKDGVTTLESGLQYTVINEGNGKSPAATDTVETHYEGRLIDGSVFDSSYQRGETVSFPVNGVIPGWTEALQLMKEGAKWQLAIPAALAYGEAGSPPVIPPNATLVFDVELVAVK
jgi:FKBP-type peptidyl-prolyl cis-trans isomerase FklB